MERTSRSAAEAHLEKLRASKMEARFDILRRLLAKKLHPDFCTGSNLEKVVRQEIFKVIWPKVDGVDIARFVGFRN